MSEHEKMSSTCGVACGNTQRGKEIQGHLEVKKGFRVGKTASLRTETKARAAARSLGRENDKSCMAGIGRRVSIGVVVVASG
jgi:hypothetical protein